MRPVELTGNDIVEKLFPIRLGNHFDRETFSIKETFFLGDYDGRAVSELNETKLQ